MVGAHVAREREPIGRRADHDHLGRAHSPGQRGGAHAHGARALNDNGIAEPDLGALDDVNRRQEPASWPR